MVRQIFAPSDKRLVRWLERLEADDYRAGVRERLLVHILLRRLAHTGELPADYSERLRMLAPLLCGSADQQQRYEAHVQAEARENLVRDVQASGLSRAAARRRQGWRIAALALLYAVVVACALEWMVSHPTPQPGTTVELPAGKPAPGTLEIDAQGEAKRTSPPIEDAATPAQPIYVPVRSFVAPPSAPPDWAGSLRIGLLLPGVLGLAWLAWRLWQRKRQRMYLEAASSAEEVDKKMLWDRESQPAPLVPAARLRPVSRNLRQRTEGERQILDLPATLRATIRHGGCILPRFRSVARTPEYLALVERTGRHDHQAQYFEKIVQALQARGVSVDLYYYEQSPEQGCWRLRKPVQGGGAPASAEQDPAYREAYDHCSFAQLSARFGGQRLLIFGDPRALEDPYSGVTLAWSGYVRAFAERAWFTPIPVNNWGRAEDIACAGNGPDFLLLPFEPAALDTLAEWLSSGRARLEQDAEAPLIYPSFLREDALAWAGRRNPPSPEVVKNLMYQLHSYLGPRRMQWLAGCAIFPALSWTLTLTIGRSLYSSPRDLALGIAALSPLPWFRYGRLPDWLREALRAELSSENETRLRDVLTRQLEQATVDPTKAELIAELAIPRRGPLLAWLANARGSAQDLLLVRFLEPGLASPLAQRLPERLRRLLFRGGSPLHGLRRWVDAVFAALFFISLIALPGPWEKFGPQPVTGAIPVQEVATGAEDGRVLAFRPDGREVLVPGPQHSLRRMDLATAAPLGSDWAGHTGQIAAIAFSPDGTLAVSLSRDQTLRLWDVASGKALGDAVPVGAGAPHALAYRPDDTVVAVVGNELQIRPVGRNPPQLASAAQLIPLAEGRDKPATEGRLAALSPDAGLLVEATDAGQLRIANLAAGLQTLRTPRLIAAAGAIDALAFAPDGAQIVGADREGHLQTWSTVADAPAAPWPGAAGAVTVLAFHPDGKMLAAGGPDGPLRLWDAVARSLLGSPPSSPAGDFRALQFAPRGTLLASLGVAGRLRLWGSDPAVPVSLLACAQVLAKDGKGLEPARSVDDSTRQLADMLAAGASAEAVAVHAPAAYLPGVWAALHPGLDKPAYREILHAATAEAAAAAERLKASLPPPDKTDDPTTPWTLRAAGSDITGLALNVCKDVPPPPPERLAAYPWPRVPLSPADLTALGKRVDGLFSTNRSARPAALQTLVARAEDISDALPLALGRALAIETGAPPGINDERSRTVQTLRLAQAALPVTLQRHADDIYRLIQAAGDNGSLAQEQIGALRPHLLAARGKQPVLNLQIAREDQRPLARQLARLFRNAKFEVHIVELRKNESPTLTELRIQGASDRALARWIANQAGTAGFMVFAVANLPTAVVVDSYELWIGDDVGGAGLPPPPVAAPVEKDPVTAPVTRKGGSDDKALKPGTRFRDCQDAGCPWLVVVPRGEFLMGSPVDEKGRQDREGPQHPVRIAELFAVMEAEVTVGQFRQFVTETGYEQKAGGCPWDKPGFAQTDEHPVVCVSWEDATAFAGWMKQRTKQPYRLLSEAEWEYAARAGSTTSYHFGNDEKGLCTYANVADQTGKKANPSWTIADCDDGYVNTSPVKHFKPNAFGLYDMHGNAWEWVQDCWHGNNEGAPTDGKSWEKGCSENSRVLRGGGWVNAPDFARSAIRGGSGPDYRDNDAGFRLARTLTSSTFTPLPPEQRISQ